jgi:high-affinity nickel permease
MLTCKRMRTAVLLSVLLLVAGLGLQTLTSTALVSAATSHLALALVLAAALVLAITFVAGLLPGASERLRECRH